MNYTIKFWENDHIIKHIKNLNKLWLDSSKSLKLLKGRKVSNLIKDFYKLKWKRISKMSKMLGRFFTKRNLYREMAINQNSKNKFKNNRIAWAETHGARN